MRVSSGNFSVSFPILSASATNAALTKEVLAKMAVTRIVVLGDSVPWGQGLLDHHKYAHLVAAGLSAGTTPAVEMYAHSGAIIDSSGKLGGEVDPCDSCSHEIPLPAPTIRAQIRKVPSPASADFVLLNGGINDVDIHRVLNPLTRTQDLSRYVQDACYAGMKLLLAEASAAFVNAEWVVITGYYPYLSDKSDQSLIQDLLSIIGISLPEHLPADPLLRQVTRLAMQFWKESDAAIAQAVAETAARPPRKLVYVPGPLQEENSLFAADPWLFGLANGINPQDEVAQPRKAACDSCYKTPPELMQHEQCRIASVGHPNVTGAQKYADAILAACT